jgi:hypothetical protein
MLVAWNSLEHTMGVDGLIRISDSGFDGFDPLGGLETGDEALMPV